jgi:phosphopantothenoylcysteine decarboxylase / phosphopantothenate---cysteine ligase
MRILVTAGPTREHLDDVRFLSNASSGRMGYAIAEEAIRAGHEVTLVSGPTSLEPPAGVVFRPVVSALDMHRAALGCFDDCDGVIAVAAVADYRPEKRFAGKLKKSAEALVLPLVPNPDILADLSRRRTRQWCVGFALESQDAIANARHKLEHKRLDLIVVNTTAAIGSETIQVTVLGPQANPVAAFAGTKSEVAAQLVELVTTRFA